MFILSWLLALITNVSFWLGVAIGGLVVGFMFKNNVQKMTTFFVGLETRFHAKLDVIKADIIAEIKKLTSKS